ncbi:transposase [Streptomyces sp. NBC_01443]|nr:transposase [Streptomyces sp. NBC_01443]
MGGRAPVLPAARTPLHPGPPLPEEAQRSGLSHQAQLATDLVGQAREAGVPFRAVVADCGYGDHDEFRHTLREAGLPFVMGAQTPPRDMGLRKRRAYPSGSSSCPGLDGS